MTTITPAHSPEPREQSGLEAPAVARPLPLSHRIDVAAIWTVVRITIARQSRGRRLLVIAVLFTLPILIAVLGRRYDPDYKADEVENVLIFGMIFQALVPLTALVFASGMVRTTLRNRP